MNYTMPVFHSSRVKKESLFRVILLLVFFFPVALQVKRQRTKGEHFSCLHKRWIIIMQTGSKLMEKIKQIRAADELILDMLLAVVCIIVYTDAYNMLY